MAMACTGRVSCAQAAPLSSQAAVAAQTMRLMMKQTHMFFLDLGPRGGFPPRGRSKQNHASLPGVGEGPIVPAYRCMSVNRKIGQSIAK
jgi:hypothetical protein